MVKVVLDEGAIMPTRAYKTDAGLDLYSRKDMIIRARKYKIFDTGVHMAFEPGTYGKIESRSGLNMQYGVVSCGGVIDEEYTGSIAVKLYNMTDRDYVVKKGNKIAQLVIMKYETPELVKADSLDDTERGNDGFGSTGK